MKICTRENIPLAYALDCRPVLDHYLSSYTWTAYLLSNRELFCDGCLQRNELRAALLWRIKTSSQQACQASEYMEASRKYVFPCNLLLYCVKSLCVFYRCSGSFFISVLYFFSGFICIAMLY